MRGSYQLGVVASALCVVAAVCLFPLQGGSPNYGMRTKNLSHAKQLATACKIYASDHEGRFPVHLSELEPDYIPKGELDKLRCSSVGREGDPTFLMDWLYFGAGFTDENPPHILIVSPQVTTSLPKPKRVIVKGDGSGRVIDEADYPPLLAETVRQMQAQDAKRREKNSQEPKNAPTAEQAPVP